MVGEPRREGEKLGIIKWSGDGDEITYQLSSLLMVLVLLSASGLVCNKVLLQSMYGYRRDDLHTKYLSNDTFFFLDFQGAETTRPNEIRLFLM